MGASSFLPTRLLALLDHGVGGDEARVAVVRGAVLMVDLSGFVRLTQDLTALGPAGAEALGNRLNGYYAAVIDRVAAEGGEIIAFSGDALYAAWTEGSDGALVETAARAGRGCLEAVSRQEVGASTSSSPLRARVGVGLGAITVCRLGGIRRQFRLLPTGTAVREATEAQHGASLDTVRLGPVAEAAARDSGLARRSDASEDPPPALPSALGEFLPEAVEARAEALEGGWRAELRRLSFLVVALGPLGELTPPDLARLQESVRVVQEHTQTLQGSLDRLSIDDKGVFALVSFGHPGATAEAHGARAATAAVLIHEALHSRGVEHRIGTATGLVFCGLAGTATRAELLVLGNAINLAVRLMQASDGRPLMPIGAGTPELVDIEVTPCGPMPVRGLDAPVEVARIARRVRRSALASSPSAALFGRSEELALLEGRVAALLAGASSNVLVESDAGLGKSTFAHAIMAMADAAGVRSVLTAPSRYSGGSPFHAWTGALATVFALPESADARAIAVRSRLEDTGLDPELLALIAPAVGVQSVETEATRAIQGASRLGRAVEVLVTLIDRCLERAPHLLVLDDAHWADSASLELAGRLSRSAAPKLLLVLRRPIDEAMGSDRRPLDLRGVTRITLSALHTDAVAALVEARLTLGAGATGVVEWLTRATGGNALLLSQVLRTLEEQANVLELPVGVRLRQIEERLRSLDLTDPVDALLRTRLDAIAWADRPLVDAAAVLKQEFTSHDLRAVASAVASCADAVDVDAALERLVDRGIMQRRRPGEFGFSHALVADVAYAAMLPGAARPLHEAVARHLVASSQGALGQSSAIAFHFDTAGLAGDAVTYYRRAAEECWAAGAFPEAAQAACRAISLIGEAPQLDPDRRLAPVLERTAALAHYETGEMATASEHARRAITLVARPLPRGGLRAVGRIVVELTRQLATVLRSRWHRPLADADAAYTEAVAARVVAQDAYFGLQTIPMVLGGLVAINRACRLPAGSELLAALGAAANVAAVAGLPRLSDLYLARGNSIKGEVPLSPGHVYLTFADALSSGSLGRLERSEAASQESEALAHQVGDLSQVRYATLIRSMVAFYRGNFHEARVHARRLMGQALDVRHPHHEVWALWSESQAQIALGRTSEAIHNLTYALASLRRHPEDASLTASLGLLARAYAIEGDFEAAGRHANELIAYAMPRRPSAFGVLEGYAGPLEVWLEHAARRPTAPCHVPLDTATRLLRRFAKAFVVGAPRVHLLDGAVALQQGRTARATAALKEARTAATRLGMAAELRRVAELEARVAVTPKALASDATAILGPP